MRVLFFYVHPAKFHLFHNTILLLQQRGHHVDVAIANKEVLSEMLDKSGIKYFNLFPNGRKVQNLPYKLNAILAVLRTIWKLFRITRAGKYDCYVTDDVLTILGRFQGVPSIAFTDNDLKTVKLYEIIFKTATKVIAPISTNIEKYTSKKIGFKGNKAIAHLHPKYFKKDKGVLAKYKLEGKEIFIIRLAKLNAGHDLHGNPGITDVDLEVLLSIIPNKYKILISTEREINEKNLELLMKVDPLDFTQVLAHSKFYIGDSGTIATEAAMLGVPNILINNIAKDCGVHVELNRLWNLQYYFDSFPDCVNFLKQLLQSDTCYESFQNAKLKYFENCDDFNEVLVNSILYYNERKTLQS